MKVSLPRLLFEGGLVAVVVVDSEGGLGGVLGGLGGVS